MENARFYCLTHSPTRTLSLWLEGQRSPEEKFEIKFMIIGLHRCITAAAAAASVPYYSERE